MGKSWFRWQVAHQQVEYVFRTSGGILASFGNWRLAERVPADIGSRLVDKSAWAVCHFRNNAAIGPGSNSTSERYMVYPCTGESSTHFWLASHYYAAGKRHSTAPIRDGEWTIASRYYRPGRGCRTSHHYYWANWRQPSPDRFIHLRHGRQDHLGLRLWHSHGRTDGANRDQGRQGRHRH